AAGAARAGMTGLRSDAATERWLRCASTRANHRVLPLRCGQQLASTPCRTRNTGFTVAKTSEGSILPRKVSESGECRLKGHMYKYLPVQMDLYFHGVAILAHCHSRRTTR